MFNSDKQIRPVLFDNLDAVFDERGSSFLSLRRVQWCEEGAEPNRDKSKLELRKWRITNDGEERADKGVAFLTDEGPHELTKVLIQQGFGHTKDILKEISKRDDFKESVMNLDKEEDISSDGEYFDMRNILLSRENCEEEDE